MNDKGKPIPPGRDIAPNERDQRMVKLEAELAQARAENAALKGRITELEQRLAELERASKRQATPFARDEHKPLQRDRGAKRARAYSLIEANRDWTRWTRPKRYDWSVAPIVAAR